MSREDERAEAVIELLRFHGELPKAYDVTFKGLGGPNYREDIKRQLAVAHVAWRHMDHRDESSARRVPNVR